MFIFHPSLCCPLRAARELQERISHQFLRQTSLPVSTHLSTGDPGEGQARLGGAGLAGVMVRRDVSYDSSLFPRSDLQRSCLATQSCPTLLRPHGLWPAGVLCPWNSPGKNTGVGCHFLLQGSSQPRDRTHMSCIAGRFFKPLSRQGSPLSAVLVADHPSEVLCRTSPCLGTEGDFNRDLLPAYYPQHPAQPKLLHERR